MLIRRPAPWRLRDADVTPESQYRNRRQIMAQFGAGAALSAGLGGLGGCARGEDAPDEAASAVGGDDAQASPYPPLTHAKTAYHPGGDLTPFEAVSNYNNFYEFGVGKGDPARHADRMTTDPWSVTVAGLAERTGVFGLEDVVDFSRLEERIYRLRCVEAWSMVIPWIGVPLADLLAQFQPTSEARYVAFETYLNAEEMPGVRWPVLDWPYREGLRLDEAMHPLAFMAVGLYGSVLPNQNGAPMRLVTPWKYGFKSIKSIATIRFVAERPPTSWEMANPREYGFYSNVNPNVAHPRWSQRSERVIGADPFARRKTEMFNGYAEEVASLYDGMDLRENF